MEPNVLAPLVTYTIIAFFRLTSWVIHLFTSAFHEDWENYLYVDPRVITDATNFILQFQSSQGDFYETEFVNVTLDNKHHFKVCASNQKPCM